MEYKKIKAFLKAEQKGVDAGKGASSRPRIAPHPNGLDSLIGTGSAFYVVPASGLEEIDYPQVEQDSRMTDYFSKKEEVEPIAQVVLTMHLYEVVDWKGKATTYRRLDYLDGEETKHVWVDRRFLDILDPNPDKMRSCTNVGQPDYHGIWKIELVELKPAGLVRVKRSSSSFELGKGTVVYWTTVMYCGIVNINHKDMQVALKGD